MPRKSLDGTKLAIDVAKLAAADKASPPTTRPSLMDAVRAFAGFIETRAGLGWTDTMIAAVLTEAGYPIDPATLRSYRKRLADEHLIRPRPKRVGAPSAIAASTTGPVEPQNQREKPPIAKPAGPVPQRPEPMPAPEPVHRTGVVPAARPPPEPPGADPPQRRTFPVNQAIRPPEEA